MYNSDIPSRAELPTTVQLVRSTIIAIVTAGVILVTIVLPSEYAIDPTGVGRALQLTEMGEIKQQLHEEAEADRLKDQQLQQVEPAPAPQSSLSDLLGGLLIATAAASETTGSSRIVLAQAEIRSDETVIVLTPGEGVEWKMAMRAGAEVRYAWSVAGGVVNYDLHGTAKGGDETSYKKDRGVGSDEGVLTAGFDGTHGWFFRNRGKADVTITLRTEGAYSDLKRAQ